MGALSAIADVVNRADLPWLAWIGLILMAGSALVWIARRLIFQLPTRYEFEKEFDAPANADARDALITLCEHAYGMMPGQDPSVHGSLRELVDQARPLSYPDVAQDTIQRWSAHEPPTWSANSPERALWRFVEWIHTAAPTPFDHPMGNLLTLKNARRVTAKFWDRWGHAIKKRRVLLGDVNVIMQSNKAQIKLVSYLEAAHHKHESWDPGPGKTGLFDLARRLGR